jgi:hypothetical protein
VSQLEADTAHDALRRALLARSSPNVITSPLLRRWLDCELGGYGVLADIQPLHVRLGAPADDPVVRRVAAYRTQIGTIIAPPRPQPIAHFFVEPIGELESLAQHARGADGTLLTVDFGPHAAVASYPRSAEFPCEVFERIVQGFLSTLDELALP